MTTDDLAGIEYWDTLWLSAEIPSPIDPHDQSRGNYQNRRLDELFRRAISGLAPERSEALEIGCARSAWLPYLSREFGFSVFGLDYSEPGCDQERQILAAAGVDGTVVCGDFFAPPEGWQDRFDFLVTFGLVEHFADQARCFAALARYLKPGGVIVTLIPNLTGLNGRLQRLLNRGVYDLHVPLGPPQLAAAHEAAGLRVIESAFFMGTNLGIVNLVGLDQASLTTRIKAAVLRNLNWLSQLIWLIEMRTRRLPPSRWLSPYVLCVARKESGSRGDGRKNHTRVSAAIDSADRR